LDGSLVLWILDFQSNRTQQVKVGQWMSDKRTTSMVSPPWCVLSPKLYTSDCKSSYPGRQLIKIADNTALVMLIQDEEKEHGPVLENFVKWCDDSHLVLNTKKEKRNAY
jgi:hypothetical protein